MKNLVSFICLGSLVTICLFSLSGCGEKKTENFPKEEVSNEASVEESTYTLDEGAYKDFIITTKSGRYLDYVETTITGAENSSIYYTLDGSAPVDYSEGVLTIGETAKKIENGEMINLDYGFWLLRAVAVNEKNHTVSPLIAENYSVYEDFDTANNDVVSGSRYEYYILHNSIQRYDTATNKTDEIKKHKSGFQIKSLNLSKYATTFEEEYGESYPPLYIPEMEAGGYSRRKTDFVERDSITYFYVIDCVEQGIGNIEYMLGYKTKSVEGIIGNFAKTIGNTGWIRSTSNSSIVIKMEEDGLVQIDEEMAKWATLLNSEVALRNQKVKEKDKYGKDIPKWQVVARDVNGTNERILFKRDKEIYLDAILKDKVMFHYVNSDGSQTHMVYDITTGEERANSYITNQKILGYTPNAVYTAKDIRRIEIEYDKL